MARTAFRFPLQSAVARREVAIGALWLLVPFVGWILNMGHRIAMTHRMQHALPAWPAWTDYRSLLKHGIITFLGMVEYHLPSLICEMAALHFQSTSLHALAAVLWIAATLAVPGYMSHYCFTLDPREVFNPLRAMRRVAEGGTAYWHAMVHRARSPALFLPRPARIRRRIPPHQRLVLASRGFRVRHRLH